MGSWLHKISKNSLASRFSSYEEIHGSQSKNIRESIMDLLLRELRFHLGVLVFVGKIIPKLTLKEAPIQFY